MNPILLKEIEIETALTNLVKYKILNFKDDKYILNKNYVIKLSKGIKSKTIEENLIELLYRASYFETARSEKEINLIINILKLKELGEK
jgi:hypothetical protein